MRLDSVQNACMCVFDLVMQHKPSVAVPELQYTACYYNELILRVLFPLPHTAVWDSSSFIRHCFYRQLIPLKRSGMHEMFYRTLTHHFIHRVCVSNIFVYPHK
jgi:hypothetical protein